MSDTTIRVLCVGIDAPSSIADDDGARWGPFEFARGPADLQQLAALQAARDAVDAVLLGVDALRPARQGGETSAWAQAAGDSAWLVVARDPSPDAALRWLRLGAQDVLTPDELASSAGLRRLRAAVERRRRERELHHAHATDLATGLPDRRRFVDHTAQLLALRERESAPLPVCLVVLRIDGLGAVEAAHGAESAHVVRRKVAVRLRAGVRASDVVASLGADAFAVLLPSAGSPAGAERVVDKLRRALREPIGVAGSSVGVTARLGLALYPRDGGDAESLLRHASARALAEVCAAGGAAAND